MLPSLIVKKPAALTAIEFQDRKSLQGNSPLSDFTYSEYERLYNQMAVHNMRGGG